MSKEVPPEEVIIFLNSLFGYFDRLVEKHRVQKVGAGNGGCSLLSWACLHARTRLVVCMHGAGRHGSVRQRTAHAAHAMVLALTCGAPCHCLQIDTVRSGATRAEKEWGGVGWCGFGLLRSALACTEACSCTEQASPRTPSARAMPDATHAFKAPCERAAWKEWHRPNHPPCSHMR